ncbi:hypothetical protein CW362_30945 [Streptomyces populi]|uniref:Uncharacterized protein n=1 Tax=Streptomyces populi TaxID=2058924 RepID=A0A2I0SH38_9ACTN|nr:hypothetical protein CW362_30945 [Streptomyces populi]
MVPFRGPPAVRGGPRLFPAFPARPPAGLLHGPGRADGHGAVLPFGEARPLFGGRLQGVPGGDRADRPDHSLERGSVPSAWRGRGVRRCRAAG